MADLKMIRTEADYAAALTEILAFDDETYERGTPDTYRKKVVNMGAAR